MLFVSKCWLQKIIILLVPQPGGFRELSLELNCFSSCFIRTIYNGEKTQMIHLYFVSCFKGSVREKSKGYNLTAKKKRFWSLLILLLSIASIRRKLLTTNYTEECRVASRQIQKVATFKSDRKIINLIPNKSFRY